MTKVAQVEAFTTPQCTRVLQMLSTSRFDNTHRVMLAGSVNSKRSTTNSTSPGFQKQQLQSNMYFHHYCNPQLITVMEKSADSLNPIAYTIANYLGKLGMFNLNECSIVNVIATLYMFEARGTPDLLALDMSQAYARLQDIKINLRSLRSKFRYAHSGITILYPSSPQDLLQSNPEAYRAAYPNPESEPIPFKYEVLPGIALQMIQGHTLSFRGFAHYV